MTKPTKKTLLRKGAIEMLRRDDACSEAMAWATETKGSPQSLWDACERADWLLWLAARVGADRKLVVLAACACARTALPHVRAGELRPLRAIETAEAWARGEATIKQVRAAASAAYAASAARAASFRNMATLVREHIPYSTLESAILENTNAE